MCKRRFCTMQKGKVLIKRENLTTAQPARGKGKSPYPAEQGVVTALWSYLHPLSPRRHPISPAETVSSQGCLTGVGVLTITAGGTVPDSHRTCFPIKPSLVLGRPCIGYKLCGNYIDEATKRQVLHVPSFSLNHLDSGVHSIN